MTSLVQKVLDLVKTSKALRAQPEELAIWLNQVPALSEDGLSKIKAVLEEERVKRIEIKEAGAAKKIALEKAHLTNLERFKRVDMPRFIKELEKAQREKKNPDDLLNQIT